MHQGHGGNLHPGAETGEGVAVLQHRTEAFSYMSLTGSMG